MAALLHQMGKNEAADKLQAYREGAPLQSTAELDFSTSCEGAVQLDSATLEPPYPFRNCVKLFLRRQDIHLELALDRLFLPPIVVGVALVASAFGAVSHRSTLLVATAASLDPWQIDV